MMLPSHLPRHRLPDVKHASQIDRDDAVPGLGIDIQEIQPVADPGRFEQDIKPPEFAHHSGNCRIDCRTIADVESRRRRLPAGATNPRRGRLGRRAVAVGAEHRRALARQRLGSGASDAASRSRNQRHFACDPSHAALLSCRRVYYPSSPLGIGAAEKIFADYSLPPINTCFAAASSSSFSLLTFG
jgi:hypothetical protein